MNSGHASWAGCPLTPSCPQAWLSWGLQWPVFPHRCPLSCPGRSFSIDCESERNLGSGNIAYRSCTFRPAWDGWQCARVLGWASRASCFQALPSLFLGSRTEVSHQALLSLSVCICEMDRQYLSDCCLECARLSGKEGCSVPVMCKAL